MTHKSENQTTYSCPFWDEAIALYNGHNLHSFKYLMLEYINFRSKAKGVLTRSAMRSVCERHGFDTKSFRILLGRCKKFLDKDELKDGVIKLSLEPNKANKANKVNKVNISLIRSDCNQGSNLITSENSEEDFLDWEWDEEA